MKEIFQASVAGIDIVPKQRLTRPGRFTKRAQRYLKSKEDLAWMFKTALNTPKPQKTYEGLVSLSAVICLTHNRVVDLDNLIGTVADALQDSGVIKNDRQIKKLDCELFQGKKVGKVIVSVKEYVEGAE